MKTYPINLSNGQPAGCPYKSFHFILFVLILVNVTACATAKAGRPAPRQLDQFPATNIPLYGKLLVKTELIFGLSKPDGGIISEAEWQKFLDESITPKFKEGLTVLNADGQYQTSSGEVAKEKSKIVILLYENSKEMDASIEAIRSSYKQLFQQESVLRITTPVGVSF
jgi:hypothetical protein